MIGTERNDGLVLPENSLKIGQLIAKIEEGTIDPKRKFTVTEVNMILDLLDYRHCRRVFKLLIKISDLKNCLERRK